MRDPDTTRDAFADDVLPGLFAVSEDPVDPNLLAAYVDGSLSELETRRMEARILRDPETLLLVRTLQQRSAARRPSTWRWVAVAAALVLVVGLAWRFLPGESATTPGLEERLVAAVASLRAEEPTLFAELQVPDRESWRANGASRGAEIVVEPTGVLLAPPTLLRWHGPEGVDRFAVRVTGPGTRIEREVEGTSLDLGTLAAGRYVVSIRALDGLAGQSVKRRFEIADETTRARHEAALARIAARDDDTRDLLAAWYALAQGLHPQARAALARAAEGPDAVRQEAERAQAHLDAIAPALR